MGRIRRIIIAALSDNENTDAIAVDKPSELKIALDNRTFEIQMFWQRSNYFLVLITAIGVAVFTLKDSLLAAILSSFGAISSYFWYKTNLGSKFWQESWEIEVVNLARQEKIASFERSTKGIVDQVRVSFEESWSGGSKDRLQRYLDSQILKKPSVSHYMILLSIASTTVWVTVTAVLVLQLVKSFGPFAFNWVEFILSGTLILILYIFR